MNKNTNAWQAIFGAGARFLLICAGFALIAGIVMFDVLVLGNDIPEQSATEISQELFLLISSLCFFRLAAKHASSRGAYVLIASFFLCMLIRELDAFFDEIQHGFWKYPAWLIALGAIVFARVKAPGSTLNALNDFSRTAQFNTLCYGMAVVLVFSRLMGMGDFWHGALGDNYVRVVKNVVEEGLELFGYGLLVCGSISYSRLMSKK